MIAGRRGWIVGLVALAVGLVGLSLALARPIAHGVQSLTMTRRALAGFHRLIAAGNIGDLESARAACSVPWRRDHPVALAPGGGVVGLPRSIHPNFRVWCAGSEVWICPTNRVGPVYRMVREGDGWKYAGLVGRLLADGTVEPLGEAAATDP